MLSTQLCHFENKSIPVCFANEVWKDPLHNLKISFLNTQSKTDPKQWNASVRWAMQWCVNLFTSHFPSTARQLAQWFIRDAMSKCFFWKHHCGSVFVLHCSMSMQAVWKSLKIGFTHNSRLTVPPFFLYNFVSQVLPYWGNPHDRKVIRKFWSQVRKKWWLWTHRYNALLCYFVVL